MEPDVYPGNSIGIVLGCEGKVTKVMKMGKREKMKRRRR